MTVSDDAAQTAPHRLRLGAESEHHQNNTDCEGGTTGFGAAIDEQALRTRALADDLQVGDVVLLQPPADGGQALAAPAVVLIERPGRDVPLLHRIVAPSPDGAGYTTRGDANPEPDSDVAAYEQIRGIGRVLVPWVGTPLLWIKDGDLLRLGLLVAAVSVLTALARYGWSDRYDPWPPAPNTDQGHHPETDPAKQEPAAGDTPREATSWRRLARMVVPVVITVATAGTATAQASAAAAGFTATTSNAVNQLTSATLAPPTDVTAATNCTAGGPTPTVIATLTDSKKKGGAHGDPAFRGFRGRRRRPAAGSSGR